MIQQADLFAPSADPRRNGEIARDRKRALAISDAVMEETLAVYRAHASEYIWSNSELRAVKEKYDLGAYFNDTIHALHRLGKLESRNVYHGAESPIGAVSDLGGRRKLKNGEKAPLPYLGYSVEYRFKAAA